MEEMHDEAGAKRREFANLLGQIGDFETMREIGIIAEGEFIEKRAKKRALCKAISRIDAGEVVSDEQLNTLIDQERKLAAQPTKLDELFTASATNQDAIAELGALTERNTTGLGDVLQAIAELGVIAGSKEVS